jgi:hypothetical protein
MHQPWRLQAALALGWSRFSKMRTYLTDIVDSILLETEAVMPILIFALCSRSLNQVLDILPHILIQLLKDRLCLFLI